jgi:hypothetical protein
MVLNIFGGGAGDSSENQDDHHQHDKVKIQKQFGFNKVGSF